MNETLYLGRARLKRDAPAAALAALLVPPQPDARIAAAHSLVWALFADGPDRRRDFLWREDAPGQFMSLSARPPTDPHGLFELDCKEFSPVLAAGDRLGFRLRANATISRSAGLGRPSKRSDVVMDALHALPKGARAGARQEAIVTAGSAWLAAQGARSGFLPGEVAVDGYDQRRLRGTLTFSTLDFEGSLTVQDPALFLARLAQGFGRARAFGCGLMLIRRAR